jgi:hypothetical protein
MFEEAVTYVLMIVTGGPVAALTWLDGGRFTAGPTICLLLFAIGVVGLAGVTLRRTVPAARALRPRSRAAQVVQRGEPG